MDHTYILYILEMGAGCVSLVEKGLNGPQMAYWNNRSRDGLIDYNIIYTTLPDVGKHKKLFDALQLLERDVGRLYKIFNRVDNDYSGTVEIIEMLMYLDIERTPFTTR